MAGAPRTARRAVASTLSATILTIAVSPSARAQEDSDLDRIPKTMQDEPAPSTEVESGPHPPNQPPPSQHNFRTKLYLEDAFTLASAPRHVVVPFRSTPPVWQNRTSLDARFEWALSRRLHLTLSDRLNVVEQDGLDLATRQTLRNDLRESYLSWEWAPRMYLEAGRVNIRNGVALGFNPTDFLRARTLVGQASLDPSVIRQNRLGTMMLRAQSIWVRGSASVAFAPRLQAPSALVGGDSLGIDPRFDATNSAHRVLCALSFDVLDLSPQLLGYFEARKTKIGVNLSRQLGESVVAYAEWAGGRESNLSARAADYGRETGTLPASAPILPPTDESRVFRNDVAVGGSWTIGTKVTVNLEYHLHQTGFSRRDWTNWFDIGAARTAAPPATSELWYVRAFANDGQEPVPMHQLFVRTAWPKVFVKELELTSFAFVDLLDGSTLAQVAGSYFLSDAWTIAIYGTANLGAARTERGSLPQLGSLTAQLVLYL
jgi:hypothetical protein